MVGFADRLETNINRHKSAYKMHHTSQLTIHRNPPSIHIIILPFKWQTTIRHSVHLIRRVEFRFKQSLKAIIPI